MLSVQFAIHFLPRQMQWVNEINKIICRNQLGREPFVELLVLAGNPHIRRQVPTANHISSVSTSYSIGSRVQKNKASEKLTFLMESLLNNTYFFFFFFFSTSSPSPAEPGHRVRAVLGPRVLLHPELHHGVCVHPDLLRRQGPGPPGDPEKAAQAAQRTGKGCKGVD